MIDIITLDDLIAHLTMLRDEHGGGVGVRIGDQPSYPFECSLGAICFDKTLDAQGAVVFCEGTQHGYGKRAWWSDDVIEPETEDDDVAFMRAADARLRLEAE